MTTFELFPQCTNRKSFYGKAFVISHNGANYLQSYNTIVCGFDKDGNFHRYWDSWSATTGKHVHEFTMQIAEMHCGKAVWDTFKPEHAPIQPTLHVNVPYFY
jgi:hypothetical protein